MGFLESCRSGLWIQVQQYTEQETQVSFSIINILIYCILKSCLSLNLVVIIFFVFLNLKLLFFFYNCIVC